METVDLDTASAAVLEAHRLITFIASHPTGGKIYKCMDTYVWLVGNKWRILSYPFNYEIWLSSLSNAYARGPRSETFALEQQKILWDLLGPVKFIRLVHDNLL